MTQLIINSVVLPKTSGDKYRCYPTKLTEQLEMISGRVVTEIRGTVQVIEYMIICLMLNTGHCWRR